MVEKQEPGQSSRSGLGVDAYGGPVWDPSKNVLDLVEAAIKRQDDLRELQAEHQTEKDDLRYQFYHELRQAETARIDAIRAVDVGAVAAAAQVSATQATTLATTVASSAEALRNQVAAAASAQTVALAAALDPIQKDIADLRRAQYEQQGSQIASPNDLKMDILLERIGKIENIGQGRQDQKAGSTSTITVAIAAVAVVLTIIGLLWVVTHQKINVTPTPTVSTYIVPNIPKTLLNSNST